MCGVQDQADESEDSEFEHEGRSSHGEDAEVWSSRDNETRDELSCYEDDAEIVAPLEGVECPAGRVEWSVLWGAYYEFADTEEDIDYRCDAEDGGRDGED